MPDYVAIADRLRKIAVDKGVDPNDTGKLTQVALKYAKTNGRQIDPVAMNDALFKAANIDPTTGQAPLPQETWGQTATTALERGANAAMQFGNAAIGNTEGTVKRMLEQDAIDAERAGRQQSLAQTAVGEVGSVLTNPLTYVGGGLSKVAAPVAQAGYQGLERFRQGAVASEDNLAAKSLIAGAAGGLGALPFAKPAIGAAANLALGSGQEVAEATIDNREIDPLSLGLGAVTQVAQSAGTLAPQVVTAIRGGRKTKIVDLDRRPLVPRVDRGADPAPGLGNTVVPKDVADAQLADLRASQSAADALNTGLPEIDTNLDAPIVGGPDVIVRKTPPPVAVAPTENAVDVMLRNQERLSAADARAADLGVNSDVNAATSVRNRQLLDELGLSDPSVQNGSIPDITPIDKIGNIDPDRTIAPVLSDVQANLAKQRGLDVTARQAGREKDARVSSAEDVRAAETSARAVAQNTDTAKKNAVQSTVDEMRQAKLFADKNAREAKQAKVDENIDRIRREREIADADAIARERQRALDERNIIRQEIESGTRPSDEATAQLTANADNIIGSTRKSALDSPVSKSVAPEVQDVADMLDAGVQMRDIVNDFNAAGVPASQHIPIIRQAQEVLRNKKVASASTGGMNFPEPIRKAPNPPKVNDVVPASEMLTMEPRSLDEAPPVAKPVEQPIQQTTSVDQPVSGVNPPVEPTPVTTPKVVEAPVDTNPVVTTETPVQRTQTLKVEDPKIAARREKLKAEQDAKKAREEKLAAERTTVAPESVPGEASIEKAPTAEAEGWKVYRDGVTNNIKATKGDLPEGAKDPGKLSDTQRANAIRRAEEAARRDPWLNNTRSGATSSISDVADAIGNGVKAAYNVSKTLMQVAKEGTTSLRNVVGYVANAIYHTIGESRLMQLTRGSKEAKAVAEHGKMAVEQYAADRAKMIPQRDALVRAYNTPGNKNIPRLQELATANIPGTGPAVGNAPLYDMIEGRTKPDSVVDKMITALWDLNRSTRKNLTDKNVPLKGSGFPNGVGMQRRSTGALFDLLSNNNYPGAKQQLVNWLAKENKLSTLEVNQYLDEMVAADAGIIKADLSYLTRLDPQEIGRKFKNFPSHIRLDNGTVVPLVDLNLGHYADSIMESSARRGAFHQEFIAKSVGDKIAALRDRGEVRAAQGMIQHFSGVDTSHSTVTDFIDYMHESKPGAILMEVNSMIRQLRLLVSNTVQNIPQAANALGYVSYGDMLAGANIKRGYDLAKAEGLLPESTVAQTSIRNFRGNKNVNRAVGYALDATQRARGEVRKIDIGLSHMTTAAVRAMADSMINRITTKGLSLGDDVRLRMLDLSDDLISRAENGTMTPKDGATIAAALERRVNATGVSKAEQGRLANNRILSFFGPRFRAFSENVVRGHIASIREIARLLKKGDSYAAAKATARLHAATNVLLGRTIGTAAMGYGGNALYTVIRNGLEGLEADFEDEDSLATHIAAIVGGGLLNNLDAMTDNVPDTLNNVARNLSGIYDTAMTLAGSPKIPLPTDKIGRGPLEVELRIARKKRGELVGVTSYVPPADFTPIKEVADFKKAVSRGDYTDAFTLIQLIKAQNPNLDKTKLRSLVKSTMVLDNLPEDKRIKLGMALGDTTRRGVMNHDMNIKMIYDSL